jgi:hypothetical protein
MSMYETEAYEGPFGGQFEQEYAGEMYGEFGELNENELAAELLEITNEQELDRFIGNLVKSVGQFARSGVGKAIGGVLKNIAKTALPVVGSAIGSFVAPGIGTAIGGKLGSLAGGLLEVNEAETMGEEEAEYAAARRFVQFGRATARYGRMAPPNVPPPAVARAAAIAAARRYAPGLVQRRTPSFRDRRSERRSAYGGAPSGGGRGYGQRPDSGYRGGRGYGRPRRPAPGVAWGAWQPADAWMNWPDEPVSGGPYGGGNGGYDGGSDNRYDNDGGDDQGWFEQE